MNPKNYILSAAMIAGMTLTANAQVENSQVATDVYHSEAVQRLLLPVDYPNSKTVVASPDFASNWFVSVGGGVNALIDWPIISCGDLIQKSRPAVNVNVGKWFTPSVGARVSATGFGYQDATGVSRKGFGVTADILWNLTSVICGPSNTRPFSFSPYVGTGVMRNPDTGAHPFALSYGFLAQYSVTPRLKVFLEVAGKTTAARFDGVNAPGWQSKDHMMSTFAGVSVALGKRGFENMPDVKPVLVDNSKLRELCSNLIDEHDRLTRESERNAFVVAELRKIMKFEGLIKRYGKMFDELTGDQNRVSKFPINDYSGLNKLRARLKGAGMQIPDVLEEDAISPELDELLRNLVADDGENNNQDSANVDLNEMLNSIVDVPSCEKVVEECATKNCDMPEYLRKVKSGEVCIGCPVYVFFKFGTHNMTETSQHINLDEIARLAKTHNLTVKVTGAADSFTGGQKVNTKLGEERAEFIVSQLKKRGVSDDKLVKVNDGGIDTFQPKQANRQTKIELFF